MSAGSSTPYAGAKAGDQARGEITRLLQHFGCKSVGFMDDFSEGSLLLVFEYRGQRVQLKASANGWAAIYLRDNPWNNRRKATESEWQRKAREKGMVAVNSILRDWVKGQITAVESGVLQFEHVFFPYMLTESGETVAERYHAKLLPEIR